MLPLHVDSLHHHTFQNVIEVTFRTPHIVSEVQQITNRITIVIASICRYNVEFRNNNSKTFNIRMPSQNTLDYKAF